MSVNIQQKDGTLLRIAGNGIIQPIMQTQKNKRR